MKVSGENGKDVEEVGKRERKVGNFMKGVGRMIRKMVMEHTPAKKDNTQENFPMINSMASEYSHEKIKINPTKEIEQMVK